MFYVYAEFNTDENNKWVIDQRIRSGDPLPMCIYGPFELETGANDYCDSFMPDDPDVYDVWVSSLTPEEGWAINDPKDYWPNGYQEVAAGSPISLVVRGENNVCNEKKSVA